MAAIADLLRMQATAVQERQFRIDQSWHLQAQEQNRAQAQQQQDQIREVRESQDRRRDETDREVTRIRDETERVRLATELEAAARQLDFVRKAAAKLDPTRLSQIITEVKATIAAKGVA